MRAGGVFFDEAGFDFGVSRTRQNAVVDAAHTAGRRVFMNAFNPDDVFLPSDGLSHRLRAEIPSCWDHFHGRAGAIRQGLCRRARALDFALVVHGPCSARLRQIPKIN
jgi:hypothetical protein